MKKLIAAALALSMTLTLLSGCGGAAGGGKGKALTLSPETTSATASGVTVDVGSYVLDSEAELAVAKRAAEENKDEGYKIESYDISVGELSQLSDFITIRIPYDEGYCEDGQDAAACVGAKYLNETTGQWEDVLFEVDAEARELVVYTDHLSVFGAFHVKNEGQRKAYITDVCADTAGIDQGQATAVLQEYVANGGEAGQAAAELGARALAGLDLTAAASGNASFATDLMGNIVNFATLGDTEFKSPLAKEHFDELGNMGKMMAAVKIGAVMLKTDKTDEDVLGLYKDTANLAMSFVESRAIGMAMTAMFVFDYTISEMFAQGMAMRRGAINEVYRFYNDSYSEGDYEARDLKAWRKALIEAVENNLENPEAAVEAEIDSYCNAFWQLPSVEFTMVADALDEKGAKGEVTVPEPTSAEAQQMTAAYKSELYERLIPVVNSIPVYMQRKAEAEYLNALTNMKALLNQTITFSFSEELAEGEEPRYPGYVMRFEPLGEGADAKTWTTGALGEGGATGRTQFTLIGYLTAGAPDTLALYKPGDTPGEAAPELTVPFTLTAPVTEVTIGISAPTFEELVGSYDDGVLTITDVFVSEALRAEMANGEGSTTTVDGTNLTIQGCDIGTIISGIEEQVGVPNPMPFTIAASGENVGTLSFDGDAVSAAYDPKTGLLTVDLGTEEGHSMGGGQILCTYNEDRSGVVLNGSLKLLLLMPEEDFHAIASITGSKPLAAPAQ